MRGGHAPLEQRPAFGQGSLVDHRQVLCGELGMGDDDLADALLEGGADDGEDLIACQMPGGEEQTVVGDALQDGARLRQDRAGEVDDRDGFDLDALLAQLQLELDPHRHLCAGGHLALVRFVDRVHGGQPHRPYPLARSDLHGQRIQATDGLVEGDRAAAVDPRNGGAHDGRALGGGGVMRLEREPVHPELEEAARQGDVVDDPGDDVGGDMDVGVIGAPQQFVGAVRHDQWLGLDGHQLGAVVVVAAISPPPLSSSPPSQNVRARAVRGRRCRGGYPSHARRPRRHGRRSPRR
jgi:hypothetical protein